MYAAGLWGCSFVALAVAAAPRQWTVRLSGPPLRGVLLVGVVVGLGHFVLSPWLWFSGGGWVTGPAVLKELVASRFLVFRAEKFHDVPVTLAHVALWFA